MSEFEALERERERQQHRLDPSVLEPVIIRSLSDIQRVLAQFAPERQQDGSDVLLSTTMEGENEQGNRELYAVTATSRSRSRRTMIIEGLEVLKRHREVAERAKVQAFPADVNGIRMMPPKPIETDPLMWCDKLIRHWFGGERRGLHIVWDVQDGWLYRYDIYTHRLTRVPNGPPTTAGTG